MSPVALAPDELPAFPAAPAAGVPLAGHVHTGMAQGFGTIPGTRLLGERAKACQDLQRAHELGHPAAAEPLRKICLSP